MGLLSGSKLRLAKSCLFPFRRDVAWVREESRASQKGRAFHAIAEGAAEDASGFDLSDADRAEVDLWAARWRESPWSQADWRHEVAFVFDGATHTARAIETTGPRGYGDLAPHEIPATADLVLVEDDRVTIADLKTGYQGDREPIEQHAQLRGLAAMACLAYGKPEARIVALYCDAEGVHPVDADLDALEIAATVAHLSDLVAGIPNARPQPGTHCGGCPAALACPSTAQQVETLARVEPVALALQTPEQASAALQRLWAVQKACEQMDSLLRAYADEHGGVPVEAGKVWRKVVGSKEEFVITDDNQPAVESVLARHGAERAVKVRIALTKAALTGVGLSKAQVEAVVAELRAVGAIRDTPTAAYRETKAR